MLLLPTNTWLISVTVKTRFQNLVLNNLLGKGGSGTLVSSRSLKIASRQMFHKGDVGFAKEILVNPIRSPVVKWV